MTRAQTSSTLMLKPMEIELSVAIGAKPKGEERLHD
jgi:hypothetical protein